MTNYVVRNLLPTDFETIMQLETDVFAADGEAILCPYYVRLCCDFFGESCFIAFDGNQAIGYVLSFLRGREVYCTTLAIHPDHQRTRAIVHLLRSFVTYVVDRVDNCWFTVDESNAAARGVHRMLGATETGTRRDFYGAGIDRLVSKIDRSTFEAMRPKYERLGLLERSEFLEAA